jgi:AraC-like DNA-binding protein
MLDFNYPDRVSWPFLGYSVEEHGGSIEAHSHEKAQLFFAISGGVVLDLDASSLILPPMSAAWIPAGTMHGSHYAGPAKVGFIYMEQRLVPCAPPVGHPIVVNGLLRELLARIFAEGVMLTPHEPRHTRLFSVLLDELASMDNVPEALRMPRDLRLRRLLVALMRDPGSTKTADAWGSHFGMSQRTLSRLFRNEIGKSFAQVREQIQVKHAEKQLEAGRSVSNVAFELGYESPSAFIAMFKRNTGETPGMFASRAKLTDRQSAEVQLFS